jgi:hypothetical protein
VGIQGARHVFQRPHQTQARVFYVFFENNAAKKEKIVCKSNKKSINLKWKIIILKFSGDSYILEKIVELFLKAPPLLFVKMFSDERLAWCLNSYLQIFP